jgi:hypothetical protein
VVVACFNIGRARSSNRQFWADVANSVPTSHVSLQCTVVPKRLRFVVLTECDAVYSDIRLHIS